MPRLGVNIDHVATVRQARRTNEPDPVWAAAQAQLGGADGITVHLREDRRHIQDRDVRLLIETVSAKLNLECAIEEEMIDIAADLHPQQVCLVPERREEITTEGGLNVARNQKQVEHAVKTLRAAGISVSLFIDAQADQIDAAKAVGADAIELHTGKYALSSGDDRHKELAKLHMAVDRGLSNDIEVHAGHGLTYDNVVPVASINGVQELNIGHSIIARSIFVGIQQAVRDMKALVGEPWWRAIG